MLLFVSVDEPEVEQHQQVPAMTNTNSVAQDDQRPSSSTAPEPAGLSLLKTGASSSSTTTNVTKRSTVATTGGIRENGGRIAYKRKKPVKVPKISSDQWMSVKKEISALIRKPAQGKKVAYFSFS